ncbi:MAG: hypothetical protein UIH27_14960 [Ruminococcus sp.]|nr:hypothetical protein [Ruminococcus sp.]
MDTKTTVQEHKFLLEAEREIVNDGITHKRCPRCGNQIEIVSDISSYTIRCKTDDCIKAEIRGI